MSELTTIYDVVGPGPNPQCGSQTLVQARSRASEHGIRQPKPEIEHWPNGSRAKACS
ncbi:hypothetical protein ASPCADRAFT_211986 [Aspergillus carbonarius ITEM 5010]|uniref:Uncharacterized protein n=1 Tax=Aspergillus carbonarius (strain ITEM 5010) TaxID=602072 RepID=A0A1R3R7I3_ASPC5|nr:hypothetical protein ASPCADRAFT_211986 [Aspergillus carbonarius ITEM 5010]